MARWPPTTTWCKVKADQNAAPGTPRRLARPALAGLALILFAAGGYAAWKYTALGPARQPSGAAVTASAAPPAAEPPASRIVRVSPANTRVIDHVRLTTEELLDPDFALFDAGALKLSAPRRLLDEIERPVLYAELVNTSDRYVALSPRAEIAVFDGSRQLDLRQSWSLPTHLYPGERVPVALTGRVERYSEVKTNWLPAKRAALPGPRAALAVTVENTEAGIGTGTLNFSYRFRYKYVTVHGRVRNDSADDVETVRVWVSLYDAQDQITGATFKELRLPRLPPGDSAPFEVDVKQYGGNFARVGVVYDASTP